MDATHPAIALVSWLCLAALGNAQGSHSVAGRPRTIGLDGYSAAPSSDRSMHPMNQSLDRSPCLNPISNQSNRIDQPINQSRPTPGA